MLLAPLLSSHTRAMEPVLNEQAPHEHPLPKIVEDLTALVEASSVLAGALKFETVLPRTMELCRMLIKADGYAVWLFDKKLGKWSVVASAGLSDEYKSLTYDSMNHSIPLLNAPLIIEEPDESEIVEAHRDLQRKEGICSLLVIPLRIAGENFRHGGVLLQDAAQILRR